LWSSIHLRNFFNSAVGPARDRERFAEALRKPGWSEPAQLVIQILARQRAGLMPQLSSSQSQLS